MDETKYDVTIVGDKVRMAPVKLSLKEKLQRYLWKKVRDHRAKNMSEPIEPPIEPTPEPIPDDWKKVQVIPLPALMDRKPSCWEWRIPKGVEVNEGLLSIEKPKAKVIEIRANPLTGTEQTKGER